MSEIKFEGWFLNKDNDGIVISNINADDACTVSAESFLNAPIKMILPDRFSDEEVLRQEFSIYDGFLEDGKNPNEFGDSLYTILHGTSPDWRLTGVEITTIGIGLCYATNNPVINHKYDTSSYTAGLIIPRLSEPLTLKFEHCLMNQLSIRYDVYAYIDCSIDVMTVQITKYIGEYQIYSLEMREDNHGKTIEDNEQYCAGILYL